MMDGNQVWNIGPMEIRPQIEAAVIPARHGVAWRHFRLLRLRHIQRCYPRRRLQRIY